MSANPKHIGLNKATVRSYFQQIVNTIEHMELLFTPAHQDWAQEYYKVGQQKDYRHYDSLDEFFEDQKKNIELIYLKLDLEKMKRELWQCLHFGMTPKEWENQNLPYPPLPWHAHQIIYGDFVFNVYNWAVGVHRKFNELDLSPGDIEGKQDAVQSSQ